MTRHLEKGLGGTAELPCLLPVSQDASPAQCIIVCPIQKASPSFSVQSLGGGGVITQIRWVKSLAM